MGVRAAIVKKKKSIKYRQARLKETKSSGGDKRGHRNQLENHSLHPVEGFRKRQTPRAGGRPRVEEIGPESWLLQAPAG